MRRGRVVIEYAGDQNARNQRRMQNRSTWMINIGTHTKPYDDVEFVHLEQSLREVIEDVLTDAEFENKAFYTVIRNNAGRLIRHTEPWGRTNEALEISRRRHVYAIERGTVTGRVDAHIIIDVKHGSSKIQVDHKAIGEMIDERLVRQNQIWMSQGQPESSNPLKVNQPLQWANPKVYTSYSPLGFNNLSGADVYIRKQTVANRRVLDADENAVNKMSISFITNPNDGAIIYHPPE
jgi:hypothetical protein